MDFITMLKALSPKTQVYNKFTLKLSFKVYNRCYTYFNQFLNFYINHKTNIICFYLFMLYILKFCFRNAHAYNRSIYIKM